jgi:hypothetical protein
MPVRSLRSDDDQVLLPRMFRDDKPRLSLSAARSLVGYWLAFTREIGPIAAAKIPTPPLVTRAYLVSNRQRELSAATRKQMTESASAVRSKPSRTLQARLQSMLDRPLPDHARIVLRTVQSRKADRPPFSVAWLEIPDQASPNYVHRFKASYSKAYHAVVYSVRGHGKRPHGPKTHPWRPVHPSALPSLHPIAQQFIHAIQTKLAAS